MQQTDVVCNAVAYMLKLTVGLNKPLLLNIKNWLKLLQYHKLQALRQVAKRHCFGSLMEQKVLGVTISSDLSLDKQVSNVCVKCFFLASPTETSPTFTRRRVREDTCARLRHDAIRLL